MPWSRTPRSASPNRHRCGEHAGGRDPRVQQDGQWRDGDTSFFKVNVWRGQAESLAESLGKGDRVMVTGRLRQRSRTTTIRYRAVLA